MCGHANLLFQKAFVPLHRFYGVRQLKYHWYCYMLGSLVMFWLTILFKFLDTSRCSWKASWLETSSWRLHNQNMYRWWKENCSNTCVFPTLFPPSLCSLAQYLSSVTHSLIVNFLALELCVILITAKFEKQLTVTVKCCCLINFFLCNHYQEQCSTMKQGRNWITEVRG